MNMSLWKAVENIGGIEADVRGWLAAHMSEGMPWLLIHADDGVIWGKLDKDGKLILSSDVFDSQTQYPAIAVELRALTIQQARVFGPAGELLIWREGPHWRGRVIMDGEVLPDQAWQEQQLLWGTASRQSQGFALLIEGAQGPQHAVPLVVSGQQRVVLTVRHYVTCDDEGQAAIVLSRLVDLGLYEPRKES